MNKASAQHLLEVEDPGIKNQLIGAINLYASIRQILDEAEAQHLQAIRRGNQYASASSDLAKKLAIAMIEAGRVLPSKEESLVEVGVVDQERPIDEA